MTSAVLDVASDPGALPVLRAELPAELRPEPDA
jgi:hypothetical protein